MFAVKFQQNMACQIASRPKSCASDVEQINLSPTWIWWTARMDPN